MPDISSAQRRKSIAIRILNQDAGKRLDAVVADAVPELSRTQITRCIRNGDITLAGDKKKPGYRVAAGDVITGSLIPSEDQQADVQAEAVDLDIIFEDSLFLVINKAPGMVVHPAPGHEHGTLAQGLLFHRPEIRGVGGLLSRSGIVHRLDKNTSGLLIVAKTESSYRYLVSQFKSRKIGKHYLGMVYGIPEKASGRIIMNIARHATNRKKMAVSRRETARHAETLWEIREPFDGMSLLKFTIKTGRTHQIRVHCAAMHHPIIGDETYGFKKAYKQLADPETQAQVIGISRQLLHAWRLELIHPASGDLLQFEAPMPQDMADFIEFCRKSAQGPSAGGGIPALIF